VSVMKRTLMMMMMTLCGSVHGLHGDRGGGAVPARGLSPQPFGPQVRQSLSIRRPNQSDFLSIRWPNRIYHILSSRPNQIHDALSNFPPKIDERLQSTGARFPAPWAAGPPISHEKKSV